MIRILGIWIGGSFLFSLIPLIMLGASQGGIVLNPIILMTCLSLGLLFGVFHCACVSIVTKNIKAQRVYIPLLAVVFLYMVWLFMKDPTCGITPENAFAKVASYLQSGGFSVSNLESPVLDKQTCTYSFAVKGEKRRYLVGPYGKLHIDSGGH